MIVWKNFVYLTWLKSELKTLESIVTADHRDRSNCLRHRRLI